MPQRVAHLDESFREGDRSGFYVLAAAVFETDHDQAREAMRTLRGRRRTAKLHWHEMDERDRHAAASTAVSLGAYLVAIGAPVPPRSQERARRIVLRRLVTELHGLGIAEITAESRGSVLDRRDVELVRSVRYDLPKGTKIRLEHVRGETEPLLWVADIVAGAVRAARQGATSYRDVLADRLTLFEIGC